MVVTDSLSYGLRDSANYFRVNIGATITNRGRSTVYFDTFCNGQLDRLANDRWHRAYTMVCPLGDDQVGLVAIAPGESHSDTYHVRANRSDGYPRFEVDTIPGAYRLVYRIHSAVNGERSQLLPEDERASNQFTLHY